MVRLNHLLATLILLSAPLVSYAQFDGKETCHVIVAIDARTEKMSYEPVLADSVMAIIKSNSLLKSGDYYSILQYSAQLDDDNFQNYVRKAKTERGQSFIFQRVDDPKDMAKVLKRYWSDFSHFPGDNQFSLSSIAKPYALMAVKTDEFLVNKTVIVLVSDHQYNGQDFYQEVKNYEDKNQISIDKDAILQPCFDLAKKYFMEYKQTLSKQFYFDGRINDRIYIDLYEFVPLSKSISLASVMYYPPVIKAKRVKNKGYKIELPMSNTNEADFAVKRLNLKEIDISGHCLDSTVLDNADSVSFIVYRSKDQVRHIEANAWLNIKDGLYGATVLTPGPNGNPGLSVRIPVEYEKPATVVFGLPLSDAFWWFDTDDQYVAASYLQAICNCLLVLICLSIVAIVVSLTRIYKPKDNQIHIE